MGNWRTVNIEGSLDEADAKAARLFVNTGEDWGRFHCLAYFGPSLCGLGPWIPSGGGEIRAVGNLSERDYGVEDVAETLTKLVEVAPSLRVAVHCGGEYESTECIATVVVVDGIVITREPAVATVGAGLAELGEGRLRAILGLEA